MNGGAQLTHERGRKDASDPAEDALEQAFRRERAESMRTRLRWLWGASLGIWVLSFVAFDLASFASRAQAAAIRGPECALALALWVWLRKPRALVALELGTVAAWAVIAGTTAYGLTLVPPERLPFKVASFALSVLVVCPLTALRWRATAAVGGITVVALATLRFLGEDDLFMASMTVFGLALGVLIASAAARDRLALRELASRLALSAANARLRRDDELRRRLFTNLSHDLRTPLAVVRGEAELLRATARSEQDSEALARIASNTRALADLAEQLLDLARLEAGQMTHRPRSCDVLRAARDVAGLLALPAGRGPRVVPPAPDRATPVLAAHVDPHHLVRILTNLVANGQRHARSAVTLAARRDGARVVVEVLDDGPGVPADRRAAIFQRFVSFDSDGTTASGIGLPLARELATTNGGALELVEDAPATTFRLTLPASDAPPEAPDTSDVPTNAPSLTHALENAAPEAARAASPARSMDRRRLLLVEDNPDMATMLRRVLERRFDVDHAGRVSEALERLERPPAPEAVLSDVLLPDGTGYEVLAAVRAQRGLEALPVVLVSALGEPEQHVRGLDAGADDYVGKPFAPEELEGRILAAIARADGRKRALDAQRDALLMEIHDGVSASLSRAAMLLAERPDHRASADGAREAIADGLDEVRAIAKLLAPRATSFDVLCAEIRRATADACAAASLRFDMETSTAPEAIPLPAPIAHALRRAAREATTNILKHAGATRVRCRLLATDEALILAIEDDGRGYPPDVGGGQGLGIMERRVARIGGRVERGDHLEGGAFLRVTIPLAR
ncbi:MAG: response regulator [Labilithrix sp.]|nr:response regulator [Labilithrix sp.]